MNILTRKLINPNIVLHDTDTDFHPVTARSEQDSEFRIVRSSNYTDLCRLIDMWKVLLLEKYDAQPGQTVFIQGHPGADYYAVAFAIWELGLTNVLDLPRCYTKEDVNGTKTKMFGIIDFIIRVNKEEDIYGAQLTGKPERWYFKPVFVHELKRDQNQSKHIITIDECYSYIVQDPAKYADVSNIVLCTPDSNLIKYPSSGTTGDPKLMFMSHNNVVQMSRRYIPNTNCIAEDRALHTNNLNHGSTLMIHWLPSFMICNEHYTANSSNLTALAKFAEKYQINRTLLYTTQLLTDWLSSIEPVDRPLHIMTLFQITTEIIKLAQEKNVTIYGMFGASDIGGFFFLKVIDKNFDPQGYDVSWMGQPVDDFWLFDLRDEELWISSPALGMDWCTANDKFKVIDNNYYFLGRANRYRLGETWFDLSDLEKLVATAFGNDANIVVDIDLQKLYLAVWAESTVNENKFIGNLITKYPNLSIAYYMRGERVEQFSSGRKVDNSKIRDYCRGRLGIVK